MDKPKSLAIAYNVQSRNRKKGVKMSAGGPVAPETPPGSIAEAIRRKRQEADQIDMDANNLEGPGTDISRNIEAKDEMAYDDDQLSDQPLESIGDDIEADTHDRVEMIRRKLKATRGF